MYHIVQGLVVRDGSLIQQNVDGPGKQSVRVLVSSMQKQWPWPRNIVLLYTISNHIKIIHSISMIKMLDWLHPRCSQGSTRSHTGESVTGSQRCNRDSEDYWPQGSEDKYIFY